MDVAELAQKRCIEGLTIREACRIFERSRSQINRVFLKLKANSFKHSGIKRKHLQILLEAMAKKRDLA